MLWWIVYHLIHTNIYQANRLLFKVHRGPSKIAASRVAFYLKCIEAPFKNAASLVVFAVAIPKLMDVITQTTHRGPVFAVATPS